MSNQKVSSLCSEEEIDEKIIQLRSGKKLASSEANLASLI